jgi:hypothetical protein
MAATAQNLKRLVRFLSSKPTLGSQPRELGMKEEQEETCHGTEG